MTRPSDPARRAMQSWCWSCHAPSGPDCPDRGKSPNQARRADRRRAQREIRKEMNRR